jgi:hypothetical protein
MVLFYIDDVKVVNVDTGVVTDGPKSRSDGSYINEAAYASGIDAIVGSYKDSRDIAVFKMTIIAPVPSTIPTQGSVTGIGSNILSNVNPDPSNAQNYKGSGGFPGILEAWGGSAYAFEVGAKGTIYVWNGGDADYWGNEICAFDCNSLTWSRITEPSATYPLSNYMSDPDYNGTAGTHGDGKPSVPHGYDSLWVTAPSVAHPSGELVCVTRLYCYGPRSPTYTSAYFDIATQTWSVPSQAQSYGSMNCATSVYDAARNRIWYRGDGSSSKIGYVDLATRVHSYENISSTSFNTYATSCYDSSRQWWFSLGKFGTPDGTVTLSLIQLNNLAAGNVTIPLSMALPLWDASIEYVAQYDRIYVYSPSDPQALYCITPGAVGTTWATTRIALTGLTIPYADLPFSKFKWASKMGAFYLLTSVSDQVWKITLS